MVDESQTIRSLKIPLIGQINDILKKGVLVEYLLLFVISLIIVLRTGATGIISPIDTMFSYYPLQNFIHYTYVWFEAQNGFVFIPTQMSQLPLLAGSSILNTIGFPLWIINRLWFIIPVFLLGSSAYYLTGSILGKTKNIRLLSLIASLLIILNYYTVLTISIGGIRELTSLAFSIFIIAFLIKGIRTKNTLYIPLIGISSVLAVGVIAYWVIAMIIALFSILVHMFLSRNFKKEIKFALLSFSVLFLSSLWWMLPYVATSGVQFYNANPSSSIQIVESFNSFLRTLILKNSIPAIPVNDIQFTVLANISGIIMVILAFICLLFKQYKKVAICLSFGVVVLILFALGGAEPFGAVYLFAYNHIPLFFIFRNPARFTAYLALFYSLLTSISLVCIIQLIRQKINKNFLRKALILVIVLFVLLLGVINSQPLLSGNMDGALKSADLPQSYCELRNYLLDQKNSGNMLVLPMPGWLSDFTWDKDLNGVVNPIRDVSPLPIIYDEYNEANLNLLQKRVANQLCSNQINYTETSLTNLLRILNIRYVLVQNDQLNPIIGMSPGTNTLILEQIKNNLNHYPYVYLQKSFGDLDLYEVNETIFLPSIFVSFNPILVNGSIEQNLEMTPERNLVSFLTSQISAMQTQLIKNYNAANIQFNSDPLLNFQQINPTKYVVHVNASIPFFLIFSQSYNTGWVATIGGQKLPDQSHLIGNYFANSWYINKTGSYTITLEFTPQNLFFTGIAISVITLIICSIFLVKNRVTIFVRNIEKK